MELRIVSLLSLFRFLLTKSPDFENTCSDGTEGSRVRVQVRNFCAGPGSGLRVKVSGSGPGSAMDPESGPLPNINAIRVNQNV